MPAPLQPPPALRARCPSQTPPPTPRPCRRGGQPAWMPRPAGVCVFARVRARVSRLLRARAPQGESPTLPPPCAARAAPRRGMRGVRRTPPGLRGEARGGGGRVVAARTAAPRARCVCGPSPSGPSVNSPLASHQIARDGRRSAQLDRASASSTQRITDGLNFEGYTAICDMRPRAFGIAWKSGQSFGTSTRAF